MLITGASALLPLLLLLDSPFFGAKDERTWYLGSDLMLESKRCVCSLCSSSEEMAGTSRRVAAASLLVASGEAALDGDLHEAEEEEEASAAASAARRRSRLLLADLSVVRGRVWQAVSGALPLAGRGWKSKERRER